MRPCARFERGLSRRAGHTVSFHAALISPGFSRWACERRCVGSSNKGFEASVGKHGSVRAGS